MSFHAGGNALKAKPDKLGHNYPQDPRLRGVGGRQTESLLHELNKLLDSDIN